MNILTEHGGYLSDKVKLDRYRQAIEEVMKPGCAVLDLGCGTGILGLLALESGAERLVALDESPALHIAQSVFDRMGHADRVRCISGNSFQVELPERVDVVICDHVGYFGFDYGIIGLLADAKARFLKPGGVLVPSRLDLKLAAVSSEEGRNRISAWRDGTVPGAYSWVAGLEANIKHGVQLSPDGILSGPTDLATLTLGDDPGPFLSWTVDLTCTRDGLIDGLGGWFDCLLAGDVWMTNSPLAEGRIDRSQVFLGLERPFSVKAGELIRATVMVRHADDVIAWVIERPDTGERYSHSTWNAMLLDGERLASARPGRVASLNARGRARKIVLSYCDGVRTVAEVEAAVLRDHPELMPSRHALSRLVMQVLGRDASE